VSGTFHKEFMKFSVPDWRSRADTMRALDRLESDLTHRSLAVARPISPPVMHVARGGWIARAELISGITVSSCSLLRKGMSYPLYATGPARSPTLQLATCRPYHRVVTFFDRTVVIKGGLET
jgi:hypothetical protein